MRINAFCRLLVVHIAMLAVARVARAADTIANISLMDGITIDAHADDWADRGFRVDAMAPANAASLTPESDDPHFRLAWDHRGLLVLVTAHRPKAIDLAKSNESVEILVGRSGSIDRYLTTIKPFAPTGEPQWTTTDFRQQMKDRRRPLKETVSVTTSPDQYVVEALLPWENVSIVPEAGATVLVQVRVNAGSEQYRWQPSAGNNVLVMCPVQLSATAASPPIEAAMAGRYERLRRIYLSVVATGNLAGKPVDVLDGNQVLGSGVLTQIGSRAQAALVLPMPPLGKSYGPLSARIGDRPLATVQLPDADLLRDNALADAPLLFKPFVFTGDHFPPCEFEDPSLIDELFGPYTLRTTYYDADFNRVKQPAKVGRYGAIVEVRSQQTGRSFKRYCTLYRQSQEIDAGKIGLPPLAGISPAVLQQQADAVSRQMQHIVRDTLYRDQTTAAFLAWLNETAPDAPPALVRNDAAERDRQWWYHLKRKTGDFVAYKYLAYTPKEDDQNADRRWPLILFLHGAGERGDDLNKLKTWGIPLLCEQGKNSGFVAICPLCPPRESWLPVALNDLLDEVMKKYRIDPDRIYVTGASMGGNGTWNFAQQYPGRVAAIAVVCGGGDASDVESLKDLPVWIFHGEKDPVVPFRREQAMIDALGKIDGRIRLTVYPGIGHECWNAAYAMPDLIPWLLQQRRGQPSQPPGNRPEEIAP